MTDEEMGRVVQNTLATLPYGKEPIFNSTMDIAVIRAVRAALEAEQQAALDAVGAVVQEQAVTIEQLLEHRATLAARVEFLRGLAWGRRLRINALMRELGQEPEYDEMEAQP